MALFKYFKKVDEDVIATCSANTGLQEAEEDAVRRQLRLVDTPATKKKRTNYGEYNELIRADVAKWGMVHGIRPAARKFGVPESTVRGFMKYYKTLVSNGTDDNPVNKLPRKSRGAKTLLPKDIDEKVVNMIQSMRAARCVVNYNIAISIAKGIVSANDRLLLKENGGNLELNYTWCQLIFRRLGYTKRKATTAKQPISPGILREIGFTFHRAIKDSVTAYDVPDDLIINIAQTLLSYVLISKYTMHKTNDKAVPISNSADYCQITGTFTVTRSGKFLPIQLIYQGKTSRCHPKFEFPSKFNITHSENHWYEH